MPIPEMRPTVAVGGNVVPFLDHLESRGRTSHVHWDGCEVQRQFYVHHYTAAPHVCEALLGFVLRGVDGTGGSIYTRYLPAFDPVYDQILYCNEARWDHVDGDKKSISNAAPIGVPGNVPALEAYQYYLGNKLDVVGKVNEVGENNVVVTEEGAIVSDVPGGAFITASYRPMISGYHPQRYNNILTPADRDRQFDFMDPILTPGTQTIPWPDGFQILKRFILTGLPNRDNVSPEVADPYTIPLIEFSVRRMFLGKVPYRALDQLLNHVNHEPWPPGEPGGLAWPYTFPQFPAETLRFDNYQETRHWSQSSDLNKWHEVKLNFSWRNHYSEDVNHLDTAEPLEGKHPVTWNHIFENPFGALLGWWPIFRVKDDVRSTKLYHTGNFAELFAPVTPQSQ
jgi:hypothetical protein